MNLNATGPPGAGHGVGPLEACPACGSDELVAVAADDETNFLCEHCGRCWHVEFARVSRVDPVSCPGCPHHRRCLERLREDEPDWELTVPPALRHPD